MGIIKQLPKFFELFKEGKELADSATWKNRTIATNVVVAFLGTAFSVAQGFGLGVQVDSDTLASVGGGIVAVVTVVNAVMHTITSSRVGLQSNGSGSTDSK